MSDVRASAARALVPLLDRRSSLSRIDDADVSPRDKGFMKALCYGVCRTLPRLEALATELLRQPFKARDRDVHALLLVGLYQLYHMRVPAHAAVGETAGAARTLGKPWATRVLNGCLRRAERERVELQAKVDRAPAAALMHPDWLLKTLRSAWPEQWRDIITANNQQPPMTLRVNTRHLSRDAYLERLNEANLSAMPSRHAADGITLDTPVDVDTLPGFRDGWVSVQDEAAQLAAPLLLDGISSDARILDACCAPGGKTAHLLERAPQLDLVALDSDATRLKRVEETLSRLSLRADMIHADARSLDWWDGKGFEALLLDAPCSGTGVIRRHPDIKHLRTPEDIASLAALQSELLDSLWTTLACGGRLLYVTCSVMPEENATQIDAFLKRTPDARALPISAEWGQAAGSGRQLLPGEGNSDGFFYALIEKIKL
ncbi:16S rRNA (cytosine(967)-C(5))-methyltransferase RsmB [Phytohalomonas tamaricis]|uniref:16S rRNA (cytosine(967)-C(5))-methyltransferase RsmB n=1 Tax=Phytohalomonas tamaricis TaxID=2081032 RepID=UPI000D0BC080|nr:16S rRNA (cytosine(967)-C(5))-methyltransferase RsmB [Phytohalomonas tamaricis]